jgi:S-adenosylmethionine hydrolase
MTVPLVTLTTDFGPRSPYVAALKGALLSVHGAVHLLDLSHSLPPQDVRYCSFFLRSAVPYFPAGTLHVVVVDPGVGTERAILYVEVGGQRLLVPDNGCWTGLVRPEQEPPRVLRVTERSWWRKDISATFHGRDIFAPVAGHLSLGLPPDRLGPRVTTWVDLPWPRLRRSGEALDGEVLFVDDFGNLITNIAAADLQNVRIGRVTVGKEPVGRFVRTYGEAAPGHLVALLSSVDLLEIAEVQGSAARRLGASVGTPVRVHISETSQGNPSGPP